jgi:hypothetical protein
MARSQISAQRLWEDSLVIRSMYEGLGQRSLPIRYCNPDPID